MVKVKVLKPFGLHKEGEIIELDDNRLEHLTRVRAVKILRVTASVAPTEETEGASEPDILEGLNHQSRENVKETLHLLGSLSQGEAGPLETLTRILKENAQLKAAFAEFEQRLPEASLEKGAPKSEDDSDTEGHQEPDGLAEDPTADQSSQQ